MDAPVSTWRHQFLLIIRQELYAGVFFSVADSEHFMQTIVGPNQWTYSVANNNFLLTYLHAEAAVTESLQRTYRR